MRSNFGHTSKMRGALAHDMRSRTEIKSSCDSSVMICVFIKLQLYSMLDMPLLYQYKERHETYHAQPSRIHISRYPAGLYRVFKHSIHSPQRHCHPQYYTNSSFIP